MKYMLHRENYLQKARNQIGGLLIISTKQKSYIPKSLKYHILLVTFTSLHKLTRLCVRISMLALLSEISLCTFTPLRPERGVQLPVGEQAILQTGEEG